MRKIIELKKGETYYRAVFYDSDLSIPCIETYIYEYYHQKHGHIFLKASTYVDKIEGNENPDIHHIAFAHGTEMCILDKKHLIKWLQEDHNSCEPSTFYDYKAI